MSTPPPPPAPPEPQPYRMVAYPNYYLAMLAHGDALTVVTLDMEKHPGLLMDMSAYGVTLWLADRLNHIRWERIDHLEWSQPE